MWIKKSISWLIIGLILVYLGERALGGMGRWALDGLGGLSILVAALLVVLQTRRPGQDPQRVTATKLCLIQYLIVLAGILLYALQLDEANLVPLGNFRTVLGVIWPVVICLGLLPAIAIELAMTAMSRSQKLEVWRVRIASRSAYAIAAGITAFAGINYAANAWNKRIDLSYFKTTAAGESTQAVVRNLTEPLQIILFFAPGSDVEAQARVYFDNLAAVNPLATVETVDQALDPELSKKARVRNNGWVALLYGTRHETLRLGDDLVAARKTLRTLDGKIQEKLLKIVRPPRVAYFTNGHLERDYTPTVEDKRLGMEDLKALFESLSYSVKRLGLGEGLGSTIPKDASIVVVAGPLEPFLPEEKTTLANYIQNGGRTLFLVDPDTGDTLDDLLANLGVQVEEDLVGDERYRVRLEGRKESPYNIVTVRADPHPSVRTIQRGMGRYYVVLLGTGTVKKMETPPPGMKVSYTLKSMPKSYIDKNSNGRFDPKEEEKKEVFFAAAIERRATAAEGDKPAQENIRSLVIADADVAGSGILGNPGNALLLSDGIRWLNGDEDQAGPIESEADLQIVHRKDKDTIWFYGTSFLIPALILAGGLTYVRRRSTVKKG